MTKQTNYVATVTDANSEFPPKGEAIPNSNRGLVTSASGQTQGSVGAKDSWFIDTNAQPLASYPNNRLPRWQDLIPLSCDFTSSMKQIPNADSLAYSNKVRLRLCYAGPYNTGFGQTLMTVRDENLRAILTPYYNNDPIAYNQSVLNSPLNGSRPINTFLQFSNGSSTIQECVLIFPDSASSYYGGSGSSFGLYGMVNVVNGQFVPTAQVWPDYAYDLNAYYDSISYWYQYNRGATFALSPGSLNTQFWNAVYNGTGSYSGYMGFSMSPYQTLINNIPTDISANALTDLIMQSLKLVGYTF
jgi:hypothetical protein